MINYNYRFSGKLFTFDIFGEEIKDQIKVTLMLILINCNNSLLNKF